jgi:predicted alpha/beta hydrolase family esterase
LPVSKLAALVLVAHTGSCAVLVEWLQMEFLVY